MTDTNRITGPGYYPKRPGAPNAFYGVPARIFVVDSYGHGWDKIWWQGSGQYTVRCVVGSAHIVEVRVVDAGEVWLYTQKLDTTLRRLDLFSFVIPHNATKPVPMVGFERADRIERWTWPGM